MVLPITSPAEIDIGSIITNLGIFSLAVAAAVGGVFTGWNKVKKSLKEDAKHAHAPGSSDYRVLSATITETQTLRSLTEANIRLADSLDKFSRKLDDVMEAVGDHRSSMRSFHEEAHRLGVSIRDANEILRGFKR